MQKREKRGSLTFGYSPCPNDTYIFYAMMHGKVPTLGLRFSEELLDIETLNSKALSSDLDLIKVSFHVFGQISNKYVFLRSGAALGRGCGPLIVSKKRFEIDELREKKIAIPGRHTTAYLLLRLFSPSLNSESSRIHVMPFHQIIQAVSSGQVDAGLIIHESRFTYPSYGLTEVIDLGRWWEDETALPIPLGGIIAKRSLGQKCIGTLSHIVNKSITYAHANTQEPLAYVQNHSQELSEEVIRQHIDLYVNDYSIDIGVEGEKAIQELFMRAADAGVMPVIKESVFL